MNLTLNYPTANTRCHEHGGYLAEINDKEEFKFIINEVLSGLDDSTVQAFKVQGLRIGAKWSGTRDVGNWVYMTSGGDVTYIYTEPGFTNALFQGEDWCLELWQRVNGRYDQVLPWAMWSRTCSWSDHRHNLCEIPAAA